MAAPFVTRFAPSPTGQLHLGHAASALAAWDAAQAAGGRFLLRIEDIDTTRARPEFAAAIEQDLAWLGLDWERPVRHQSEHLDDYAEALAQLRRRGWLYRCFRTRREIAAAIASAPQAGDLPDAEAFVGGALDADEEATRLARGEPFAWRLAVASALTSLSPDRRAALDFLEEGSGPDGERGLIAADPARLGDVVLARKDVGVAYHLAVVVDDALQGVTHVIRGADLFAVTHVQRLIQAGLDLPTPTYRHHPLRLGPDGARLAKRTGAPGLADLRARGATLQEIRHHLQES